MRGYHLWVLLTWVAIPAMALAEQPAAPQAAPAAAVSSVPNDEATPADAAVAGAPDEAASCIPACRDGFICHGGQCVSACNPPCASGQVCRGAGTCAWEPAPPAAPALAPDEIERIVAERKAEEERATVHRHDGFYFRFGFTVGFAIDHVDAPDGSVTESSGPGGFIDYAVGGTLTDGLVLAFAQHTLGVFSPNTTVGGTNFDVDHSALYQVLGVLVDWYPDATRGFHVAGTLGFGAANILYNNTENDLGFGSTLAAGYDFWVGDQWSLGAAAQLFFITGSGDEFGDHRAVVPMLALSALLH